MVKANLKASVTESISCEVFNIACGGSISISDIAGRLNRILGKDMQPELASKRAGDVRKTYADIFKKQKITGPGMDFYEALKFTLDWFKQNRERLVRI